LEQGDELEIVGVHRALREGSGLFVTDITKGTTVALEHSLTRRQVEILLAGGLLNYVRDGGK
jgi:aconitate hydratase